MISEFKFIRYR